MRDGIPRKLPVPRKWQIATEVAARPADRETGRLKEAVCNAAWETLKQSLTDRGLRLVRQYAADEDAALPGFAAPIDPKKFPTDARGDVVVELAAKIDAGIRSGQSKHDACRDALAHQIACQTAAHTRQIAESLAGQIPSSELSVIKSEFDRACGSINYQSEATNVLSEHSSVRPSPGRISADEDLRGTSK